ncbi:MAG: hypothetical protein K6A89_10625 [Treponema sp.]|nr:hypothetical protein [Treponema sp.]
MPIAWGIGLVTGLLVAAFAIVIYKKSRKGKCEYDERQVAARGRAFAGGFVTFVFSELVVFIIEIFTGEPLVIGVPGTLSIIICLLSTLVFLEVSIFSDAYFSPGKPMKKSWWVIMTLLGISFIIKFFLDNDYWYQLINLAAGCFIVIVMLSILVKQLISRKADKEENDE